MEVIIVKTEVEKKHKNIIYIYYIYNMNQYMMCGGCVCLILLIAINGALLGVITDGAGCNEY